MKILVFGGTGFIGSALVPFLRQQGFRVYIFSRNPKSGQYYWNPEKGDLDRTALEGCDGVINLCGENIFGRGSPKKRALILKSRLQAAHVIIEALNSLSFPPKFYLGASAVGYYGDRVYEPLVETSAPGTTFFADVCMRLEKLTEKLKYKDIRCVNARFGMVLGKSGGAYPKMETLFKWGLGAILGNGNQIVSWIALEDLLSAIVFTMSKNNIQGSVNFTAPYPVTNAEMAQIMANTLSRPLLLRIPKWLLNWILGSTSDLLLESQSAYPKVLTNSGFIFRYPDIDSLFDHLKNSK